MTDISSVRLSLRLLTLCFLATCLCFFWRSAASPQKNSGPRSLNVKVRQLDQVGAALPVDLTCEDAKLIGTGRITQLTCTIKNNSLAPMVAGTLKVSITIDANGKEEFVSGYHTFDTYLHPDFREENENNLIQPGTLYRLNMPPADYGDATVKEIEAELDYIEFLNSPSVGPDHVGSHTLSDIHEGAKKYKNWLLKQYKQDASSVNVIADLLGNETLPTDEIGLENVDQSTGASMYRKFARRFYISKGSQEFLKHLK